MKLNKLTKILGVGLLLHLPMVAEAASPQRLVTTQVSIVDSNGYPVENGQYTWKTLDGLARSSKAIPGTGLGVVELNSVPTQEVELELRSGITADGFCMFAKTRIVPIAGKIKVVLPEFELPVVRKIVVELPSGHPVPNATVNTKNLVGRVILKTDTFTGVLAGTRANVKGKPEFGYQCFDYMYSDFNSGRWSIGPQEFNFDGLRRDEVKIKGVTDATGSVTLKGWEFATNTETLAELGMRVPAQAQAIFNDGVLYQKTPLVDTNPEEVTKLTLNYFPILQTSSDDIDAYMNELVSLPVSVVDSADLEPMSFSRFISEPRVARASFVGKPSAAFSGVEVEVVSPPSSQGVKCNKKQTLKAKTTSKGKAVLKVCVTTSGNYQIKGKGAISLGNVSIHVKGAPPMAPTALSTRTGAKKATVAWGLPTYSGGTPILKYVVTATSSGQKAKKVEVKANTPAFKARKLDLTGLAAPKNWQISVVAITTYGEGEKATVYANVPSK